MSHVSSGPDALPPRTAPLAERLKAAMERAGYTSKRKLGLALGSTDGSLVGKWLSGEVKEIKSLRHRKRLPELLGTPGDYFEGDSRTDRLEELATKLGDVIEQQKKDRQQIGRLQSRIRRLEAQRGGGAGAAKDSR